MTKLHDNGSLWRGKPFSAMDAERANVSAEELEVALTGDITALMRAFIWDKTP
jgi:hypothetical protein